MKTSTFVKSKGHLHKTCQASWQAAKQWFLSTPERALDRAYSAALLIKSLEYESFEASKIPNYSTESMVQANFGKFLSIIHLRLAEFKASHSMLGHPNSTCAETLKRINTNVEKLQIIDEVLDQYLIEQHSRILPLFQKKGPAQSRTYSSSPITIDVQATKIPY
ncbi:hypothetical protein [Phormidesmis sp. 146-33]